jgi:mannose-6-phosphate isomerase-like protein (cupin superfamily)
MAKDNALRGAAKKEAFHLAAESNIEQFSFENPDIDLPDGQKLHVRLAGTDSCRASIQVLKKGGDNNLHYHPNMDLIYMVLKGKIRFYGPDDAVIGDYGPNQGLLLPENTRYWFKSLGEEEAWLLQIAGYPKGAEASRRIPCEAPKAASGGAWFGLSEREAEHQRRNNRA